MESAVDTADSIEPNISNIDEHASGGGDDDRKVNVCVYDIKLC